MDKTKALDKIRKCLALAKSGNANEAATALRQAQALMREHGLDETDLQISDVDEHAADTRLQTITLWETRLARLVADAFGCELLASTRYAAAPPNIRRTWCFIGVGAASQVASYSMAVLARQCAKARLAHIAAQPRSCKPITKTARGDEFALYWVAGVSRLVQAQAGGESHKARLLAYLERKHPGLGTVTPKDRAAGRNVRSDSADAGYAAGRAAQMHQGLHGSEAARRLT